jgi:predicted phosphodiesterase
MPHARTKARQVAIAMCEKYPDTESRQLARKLRTEHPKLYSSIDNARNHVRLIRGQLGKAKRNQADLPKAPGRAGQTPKMPQSLSEPFSKFVFDGAERVGIISDIHVPYHSERAWEAAMRRLCANECDGILINGDFCDFYRISRYEKDPEARSFGDELRMCIEGLQYIRDWFPAARIVLKLGNHEERFDAFIWQRAPELYSVQACRIHQLLKLDSMGIEMVSDQRPVMLGKLPVLHGHELQKGISAPVNPARGAFLRSLHTLAVGHSHRTSTHVEPDMFGSEVAVWSIGCLSSPNPEYNRFAKSNHGFAFVRLCSDGQFDFENYRISKDWQVRTA